MPVTSSTRPKRPSGMRPRIYVGVGEVGERSGGSVLDELQEEPLNPALLERVRRLRSGGPAWSAGSWQLLSKVMEAGRDASPTRAKTILAMMDRADRVFATADDPYLRCPDYLVYSRHLIATKLAHARFLAYQALGDEARAMEQVARIQEVFPGHPVVAEKVARGFLAGGPAQN